MFECPYCQTSITLINLISHVNTLHRLLKNQESKCKICKRAFVNFHTLKVHMFRDHLTHANNNSVPLIGQDTPGNSIDLSTDNESEEQQLFKPPNNDEIAEKKLINLTTVTNENKEQRSDQDKFEKITAGKKDQQHNLMIDSCGKSLKNLLPTDKVQIIDVLKLVLGVRESCTESITNPFVGSPSDVMQKNNNGPQNVFATDSQKTTLPSLAESMTKKFLFVLNSTETLTPESYSSMIDHEVDKIVSYLYAKPTFCREDVKDVINLFKCFYNKK